MTRTGWCILTASTTFSINSTHTNRFGVTTAHALSQPPVAHTHRTQPSSWPHRSTTLCRGPMHWAHATSTDLVHWHHLPIALRPDHLGMIFSGSVVVDHANTARFGAGSMVAVFTHASEEGQSQSLAYSTDRGRTWTKYSRNPVLQADAQDFRDPKVRWHAPTMRWVMTLAVGDRVHFYGAVRATTRATRSNSTHLTSLRSHRGSPTSRGGRCCPRSGSGQTGTTLAAMRVCGSAPIWWPSMGNGCCS